MSVAWASFTNGFHEEDRRRWEEPEMDSFHGSLGDTKLRMADVMFEEISDGVMIMERDGRLIDLNPSLLRLLGSVREEWIGKKPHFIRPHLYDLNYYRSLWERVNKVGRWSGTIAICDGCDEMRLTRMTIRSINNKENHSVHYVGVMQLVA